MNKLAQYRMWMESKGSNKSHFEASAAINSCEEEGFGGFIWPRRSYNCSFCKREFKSAQGLGGHMNVHRKERARLNNQLSPSPHDHHHGTPYHHDQSMGAGEYPDQICNLVHNPNPRIDESSPSSSSDGQSLPFFLIPCSFSRNHQRSETVGLSRGTIEDIDLELRLGDPPKVK